MKIETRYNIADKGYAMLNNKVEEVHVKAILALCSMDNNSETKIKYEMMFTDPKTPNSFRTVAGAGTSLYTKTFYEENVFSTKEELLASL